MSDTRPSAPPSPTAHDPSFDPDPPECLSQIWGDAASRAYAGHAAKLREQGRDLEANAALDLATYYGGFRRLVR